MQHSTPRLHFTVLWRDKVFKDRTWAGAKYQNYAKKLLSLETLDDVSLFPV